MYSVLNTESLGDVPINDSDILSEFSGTEDSIVNARKTLKSNLAKSSVVATKDQIRACVNSHPNVVDSFVVRGSEKNSVITYIKPRSAGDVYDDVVEELRLYGEIVTTYKALEGIRVQIILSTFEEVSEEGKVQITSYLLNRLAYLELPYKTSIYRLPIEHDRRPPS